MAIIFDFCVHLEDLTRNHNVYHYAMLGKAENLWYYSPALFNIWVAKVKRDYLITDYSYYLDSLMFMSQLIHFYVGH